MLLSSLQGMPKVRGSGKREVGLARDSPLGLPQPLLPVFPANRPGGRVQLPYKSKQRQRWHRDDSDDDRGDAVKGQRFRLPQVEQGRHQVVRRKQLCRQWVMRHQEEEAAAIRVVDIARELFYEVILQRNGFSCVREMDQLRVLAAKAAVSCFLLETIVEALPLHEVLRSCVGMLLRGVYVPDTEEMARLLGGTTYYPLLLEDIPVDSASRALILPYARKTYFIAHYELTQVVIAYAHANLSMKHHFRRLPRIFALLNANWVKSFKRTILRAWKCVCDNRRQNEQKYRTRWAKRFALERIHGVVRWWRVYANVRLHSAAAAESIKSRISALKKSIHRLEGEIEVLEAESAALSTELEIKETHYIAVGKRIAETESEYKRKLEQVREMDCVGSRLLDSLLLKTSFPANAEGLSPLEVLVLWANTTLMESPLGLLFVDMTDDQFAELVGSWDMTAHSGVQLNSVSKGALPFTPLLEETARVSLPLHRLLGLIRAIDLQSVGPSREDLKTVCITDAKLRGLQAQLETEVVDDAELKTIPVLEMEVGQMLINAYQVLTGSICIVTAEQLMSRQRRNQLVFLAGLMRFFTNWVGNKVRKQRPIDDTCASPTSATVRELDPNFVGAQEEAPALGENVLGNSGAVGNHLGVRSRKCGDWYHPPQNHVHWPLRVENQRRWIAASLSALHQAINVDSGPCTVLTSELQDDTPVFMENVTLARLSDILPKDAFDSNTFFFIAKCVEDVFPKLRALFLQYTDPRNGGCDKKAALRHVTTLDFWRMLRDCRVIGGRGKLHRAVVRRVLAKVSDDNPSQQNNFTVSMGSEVLAVTKKSRQLRETVEIDLKSSHYKMHLNAAEFVEALLRCAQAWDSLRQLQLVEERTLVTGSSNTTTGTSDDATSKVKVQPQVRYEADDPTWKLRPAAVSDFLRECLVSHGFRGPTLNPFRRAMRHAKVRECIAIHQERLFSIFVGYAKPKEACGIRLMVQDIDPNAHKAQSEESISLSGVSMTSTIPSNVHPKGLGIVRVMTLTAVQLMVVEFEWFRIRRVTPHAIEEAFAAVAADADREPEVIFFPEWLDLLCVMAQYHKPSPILPLHEKLVDFLKEYVLKFYKGNH